MGETTGLTRTLAGHALIGCADGSQDTGHGAGSLNYHHPHLLRPPAPTAGGHQRRDDGWCRPAFMFTKTA